MSFWNTGIPEDRRAEIKVERRKRYLANREAAKAQSQAWRKANPERVKAQIKRWHQEHPR